MSASRPRDSGVANQPLDRFVNEPVARAAAGVKSRSTLHSMIEEGLFPKPIRVSRGRIAWSAAEIAAWQKARMQERDPKDGSQAGDRKRSAVHFRDNR
jgi:predicted DNA-binding transcriptional regulator AlpA